MVTPDASGILTASDWLLTIGRMAPTSEELLSGLCEFLLSRGLPLDRVGVHGRTLHPQVAGTGLRWWPGKPVKLVPVGYDVLESEAYAGSPLYPAFEHAQIVRRRLTGRSAPDDFPILADLRAEGLTDYFVTPLQMPDGRHNACTWATKRPSGFSDSDISTILALLPALATCMQARALQHVMSGLLAVYLGPLASRQVLDGRIHRGDGTMIAAAIWLCDMRDFSLLSETRPLEEVIGLLDEFFETMAGPVSLHGGEVLKFIGDAMLAIFPIDDEHGGDRVCQRALVAAKEALSRLETANERRRSRGDREIRQGLALHVGTVMYGNIGAPDRLDFTVIGPAVNLTARLARLCRPLGRQLLASEPFASPCGAELVSLGRQRLDGLVEPQEIFGLPTITGDHAREPAR